jgi:hypothetical protein
MVDEIITALSRIRWLFVIARNSTLTYKGQPIDVNQVGRELGVRYVLEGSVRRAGERVRITAQLIDAPDRTHLWADRYEGSLEDIFDLQDKVASTVAGVIEPTLQAAETARSRSRPTTDLTAYDLFLRALAHSLSYERDQLTRSLNLLQQVIERDPQYGPALALAAHCHQRFGVMNWTENLEAVRLQVSVLRDRHCASAPMIPMFSHLPRSLSDTLARKSMSRSALSTVAWNSTRVMLAPGTGAGCSGSLPVSLN